MIVDSSAIVAIMRAEPERPAFLATLISNPVRRIGAPTLLETSIVLAGTKGTEALAELDRFVALLNIETVTFTPDHAAVARDAFLRFGKGRHPAALNFGDCMAYAVSKIEQLPLLFKGDDFARTDVSKAL